MTKSSLRERFEQRGLIRGTGAASSGSLEIVVLARGGELSQARSVDAVIASRRRGVPTLKAKRAVESAMARQPNVVSVPRVEDVSVLAQELRYCGFVLSTVTTRRVDVKSLRKRLGLTQEQFALRFGLELDAIQNWEHGRREPNAAARSYLTVIEKAPEAAQAALAVPVV